jgi:hypothetical protein
MCVTMKPRRNEEAQAHIGAVELKGERLRYWADLAGIPRMTSAPNLLVNEIMFHLNPAIFLKYFLTVFLFYLSYILLTIYNI